ncbi:AAA domain-containing protein [Fulvivirga lutea]|uniref:DNA helicase n=1 Tax=Fulvivirga lutea TaxID=2810512 RepID=A0A975A043_9BACT|nr:AAA domain-containing protein [Fulvivirga lutea]QSE96072.1 AAA family ATPase [Fulvivirga lutea]
MPDIDQGIKRLIELLKIEKEEDLLQYKLKMSDTSIAERRKQGVCWFPLIIENTRFNAGERLVISVRRPDKYQEPHLFSSGKLVSFFSAEGENKESINGVVNNVSKDQMLITLNSDDEPYWMKKGQLGVQLLFDESSYREMNKALKKLIKTEEAHTLKLKNILLGNETPLFKESKPYQSQGLNDSQNTALNKVLNAETVSVIHGPPGTGKTTTLIESIVETLKSENQVLVCAPSNNAVDLLVEKLTEHQVNVLRIGHPARVTEEMLSLTLDAKIANHKDFKDYKAMRKKADEFFGMAKKYKRSFGYAEREQRKLLYDEAHQYKDAAEQLNFYITNDIISKAQVIAGTLVAANNYAVKGIKFKTVFIDEAAQALEPATWIPILKAERVIFAGDHHQLPPTIKSMEAAKGGLDVSLFEKAMRKNEAQTLLQVQYRMNEVIMGFSNNYFYDGQLKAHTSVANHTIFPEDDPLEFIDTAGTGFYESIDPETKSSFNEEEAGILQTHLTNYLNQLISIGGTKELSVGIIAPYSAQITRLKERIEAPEGFEGKLSINTIDGFQGQERDIIYISMVRSNEKGEIGFLANERRMNVAMTRAKKKLVVVGDSATLSQNKFYNAFIEYAQSNGLYKSAYEFMY